MWLYNDRSGRGSVGLLRHSGKSIWYIRRSRICCLLRDGKLNCSSIVIRPKLFRGG